MSVNVQYVGFTAKAMVREYSFLVRESSIDSHEVTFTILNEAFTSHRLSLQNGPDICSLKLHRELADSSNGPLKTHYRISENRAGCLPGVAYFGNSEGPLSAESC
jgi:hypothetical protein